MIFQETPLAGAFIISLEKLIDDRGYFARSWDKMEFDRRGLDNELVQCNVSFNPVIGTLRGIHYQIPPYAETKLVRCTRGRIFDVLLDLRPDSLTFSEYFGIELTPNNDRMVYIPKGFGHGFITLEANSEIFYQISEYYSPDHSRGVRWNDPLFGIKWPREVVSISQKDKDYPDSKPSQFFDLRA